jgi:uncharacterized protein (DUF488 family)
MQAVFTIGVYGWDEERFLVALRSSSVDEVWDVRDRRGVRGRDGAWANATHLAAGLSSAGMGYRHLRELAPPTELRRRLQQDDRDHGRRHRDRVELPPWFIQTYREQVLDKVDLAGLLDGPGRPERPALLCVEGVPTACHRALAAEAIAELAGIQVHPLSP